MWAQPVVIRGREPISNPAVSEAPSAATETAEAEGIVASVRAYLLNSTLHGLRYVGQTSISTAERCFFGGAFVLVVLLAAFFISNVYVKWRASPIIISLNAATTSITDFPFPAVTICNMNQARKDVAQTFQPNSNDALLLRSMCGRRNSTVGLAHATDTSWPYFQSFLKRVSRPCRDILVTCQFGMRSHQCMEIFETTLTDEGVCCIFNGVHKRILLQNYKEDANFDEPDPNTDPSATDSPSTTTSATTTTPPTTTTERPNWQTSNTTYSPIAWTAENGFEAGADRHTTYPRRALGSGNHMGLVVMLNVFSDDYYCSTTNSAGFKVLLHPPGEEPTIADYGLAIAPGCETRVMIMPQLTVASTRIRNVPIWQRQCIFGDEANLTYFRSYSRRNCEMECESRLVNEVCGCIMYYMPRVVDNIVICSREDIECSKQLRLTIQMGQNETYRCDCLPGCFEVTYRAELTSTVLSNEFHVPQVKLRRHKMDYLRRNLAVMHVYYESGSYRSYKKDELIGFTEFLSNTGGLLGLFMGFSVVTIIEIVYFVTIRPYCASQRKPISQISTLRRAGLVAIPSITISQSLYGGPPKPFAVKYRHVRRRLCDMQMPKY